ncbi:DNA polymerase domain-containing protein [Bodo saltans virus]|uniref:DNA polymerase domain-containing protein n=1 Tax=Bodo saltans virus TaxID=2024608 RepID=A0A2H4UTC3_9VIRU|nr:DNA polymerase domain-containing protein [Bodo saltans virus]ATZ80148.1 DNA polymerase domain-containing protein [Bodo saltans virus]
MKKPKEKIKVKDKENFDFMKTNKDNINNVIKDTTILPIIDELVNRVNKIVIHAYQFLKLQCIYLFKNNQSFPIIDKKYICDIFKVITKRKCNFGAYTENNMPEQMKTLNDFFKNHYSKLITVDEILYYDKLSYILAYEAIDMVTNINNNIEMHFIDHLNKYVNIVFDVKNKADQITKDNKNKIIRKELHKQLYDEFKKVKNDIIAFGEFTSDKKYHDWIKDQKLKLFGSKTKFEKDSIHYDLKSNTQDYLKSMFHIANELEKINDKIMENNEKNGTENKQIRLFNVLPLRKNIVPKHITIDTCGLIQNFLGEESTSEHLKNYKKNNEYHILWDRFFDLKKRTFKKNKYTFSHMIKTDGISCCILFVRIDVNGKALKKTFQNKQCSEEINTDYIENTVITEEMKQMKPVCTDPNYGDLIYCGAKDENGNLQTFRYTQNQRRLETRNKKYNKIIDSINKSTEISVNKNLIGEYNVIVKNHNENIKKSNNKKIKEKKEKVDKLTIKELETILSKFNSKTNNLDKINKYVSKKNEINKILNEHYAQKVFRKLQLNIFINTQRSESKMIQNFIKVFGNPEDTIFIIGDYDKGSYNMRGKEPAICKKFRRIFKNDGFMTFLINEFRTSMLCNECCEELEKFHKRLSHKPKLFKEGKSELVHGLLRCQSVKHECEVIHNRDKNSVQNMLNIVKSIFETGFRPKKFSRTE